MPPLSSPVTRHCLRLALLAVVALNAGMTNADACPIEAGPVRAVARVPDGQTLVLDDGSEVRLAGALAPHSFDAESTTELWLPEQDARQALERLVAGQSVSLGFAAGRRTDRNGRLLAQVFLATGGSSVWVQGRMVETGHARAFAMPGTASCLDALVELEGRARDANLGLWRSAAYQIRVADDVRELLRYRDTYQVVEGTVVSANDVRGELFLNFGDDWRKDFTVLVRPDLKRVLVARVNDPARLAGRRVRVRGWITWRNGPFIQLRDASEMEMIKAP